MFYKGSGLIKKLALFMTRHILKIDFGPRLGLKNQFQLQVRANLYCLHVFMQLYNKGLKLTRSLELFHQ